MDEHYLLGLLKAIVPNIDPGWKKKHARFLTDENLSLFSKNAIACCLDNTSFLSRPPFFKEELKVSISNECSRLGVVFSNFGKEEHKLKSYLIEAIEGIPFEAILILLGQRLTPASVRDERAIPPETSILLESCLKPYNSETSMVVRALEKHIGRTENSIFGVLKGDQYKKQSDALKLVDFVLKNYSWWNVFHHYKHGLVYEIRIENGQGMRWSADGKQFIGFLEPFLEE